MSMVPFGWNRQRGPGRCRTFSQQLGLTGLMDQFRNKIGNHSLEVLNARSTSSRWLHCCDGSENRGSNLGAEQDSCCVMGGGEYSRRLGLRSWRFLGGSLSLV
jgi:hypothetical protein